MYKKHTHFIGGSGGKGGGHTPTEAPDSLKSIQKARFLELICEGEIGGLVNGVKSIYLNDIPLQNDDDTYNFQNVTVVERVGTQGQDPIQVGTHQYSGAESPIFEGSTRIRKAYPIVQHIADTNATSIKITIGVLRFTFQSMKDGDIEGTSVEYKFEISEDGGPYKQYGAVQKLEGKSAGKYQRSYLLALSGAGPWDVKITRITNDSTTSNLQNDIYVDGITQIIDRKFTYPNSALIGMEIDATQFSSIPKRGYLMDLLKIKIPSNYDPVTRQYSGSWDGSFNIAVSDNPAWVFYDLVTSDRYGLKKYIDTSNLLNKWQLYTIGRYCDVMVNNGKGGTEPRFTCNIFIQSLKEALKVVKDIASIFNSMTYWFAGGISIVQDSPADPLYTFTNANVKGGNFNTSGSALGTRHTVALVTWNDPENLYKQTVEYVEDDDGLRLYGYVPTEVVALGCISQGQAHRMGRMILLTERLLTDTITFETALEGYAVYPGAIINIGDAYSTGKRWGGRIVAATTSQITLDSNVTLEAGRTYELSCYIKPASFYEVDDLPSNSGGYSPGDIVYCRNEGRYYIFENGGFATYEVIKTSTVTTGAGTTNVLNVSPAFSNIPGKESPWILASDEYELEQYRIVSIKEADDGIYQQIVAMQHNPEKYAAIENDYILEDSLPPVYEVSPLFPCSDLNVEPIIITAVNDQWLNLLVTWIPPSDPRVNSFEVQHKFESGNWETYFSTENQFELQRAKLGTHYFRVRSKSGISDTMASPWTEFAYVLNVQTSMPNVHGLELFGQGNDTNFSGKDAHFTWRKTSWTLWNELGQEPQGGDSGALDAYFSDYLVTIKTIDGAIIRQEAVRNNEYIYTFEKNLDDASTIGLTSPIRNFTIEVTVRGRQNQVSLVPAKLTVLNPVPTMAGTIPTVIPAVRGLKVDWSSIIPIDIDLQSYEICADIFSPPTTVRYTASAIEKSIILQDLSTEESYYVQITPSDYYGKGISSDIPDTVTPIIIPSVDIGFELSASITFSDSLTTDPAILSGLYDGVINEDPAVIVYDPIGSDDWVQYSFNIAEYIDRVIIHLHGDSTSVRAYIAVSDVTVPTFPTDWIFLACESDIIHDPNSNGALTLVANQSEAFSNYWSLDVGINAAIFPNKLVAKHCRLFITSSSGSAHINELKFVRQVLAEEVVADNLAAITANLGDIVSGTIQSPGWPNSGSQYDITGNSITFGGSADPFFRVDATGLYFSIGGVESTTLIQGGKIGTGLVVADSIEAGQISADRFTVNLEGDLNQALYYVKQVLSIGDDYSHILNESDLLNGMSINFDADYHSDYGISLRLSSQVLWNNGIWDIGTWDGPNELSGSWNSLEFDLGGEKTLSLSLETKLYENVPGDVVKIVSFIYSHDGITWGSNGTTLDDGLYEGAIYRALSSPTVQYVGSIKTFRYYKVRIAFFSSYSTSNAIFYDPKILGNIVNGFQSFANQIIPVGGKAFTLSGFTSPPAVTVTSITDIRHIKITNLTKDGFTVQLYNASGSTDVGGTASVIVMGA